MALTKAEQKELDDLRARAEVAEEANTNLATANDEANVKLAEAEIAKQDAIAEAVEARDAEIRLELESTSGGVDPSFSPKAAAKFNRGAYFSTCHSGGDAAFVQNGWFYNNDGKPLTPTNKPK